MSPASPGWGRGTDSDGVLVAVSEEGDVTPHEDEAKKTPLVLPHPFTRRSLSSLRIGPNSLRRGMRRYSRLKKPSPLLQHVDEGRPLAGASPMAFSSISATETPMRRALSSSPWLPLSTTYAFPTANLAGNHPDTASQLIIGMVRQSHLSYNFTNFWKF